MGMGGLTDIFLVTCEFDIFSVLIYIPAFSWRNVSCSYLRAPLFLCMCICVCVCLCVCARVCECMLMCACSSGTILLTLTWELTNQARLDQPKILGIDTPVSASPVSGVQSGLPWQLISHGLWRSSSGAHACITNNFLHIVDILYFLAIINIVFKSVYQSTLSVIQKHTILVYEH